jgi:hypothetical protein
MNRPTCVCTAAPTRPSVSTRSTTTCTGGIAWAANSSLSVRRELHDQRAARDRGLHRRHLRCWDVVVQVSQPRSPCYRLAALHNRPDMVKWVVSTGYTGFYVRTLRPGTVEPGARITLLFRSSPGVTVARTNDVTYASRPLEADVTAVMESQGLASTWREGLEDRLRRLSRGSQ